MGCDAYGDAAMLGEGAGAKPPGEDLEANDEAGKLRAYYAALKAGTAEDSPRAVGENDGFGRLSDQLPDVTWLPGQNGIWLVKSLWMEAMVHLVR